jgi:hypothetical protein
MRGRTASARTARGSGDLLGAQAVDHAARLQVAEAVGITPAPPPPRSALVQLEIAARAAVRAALQRRPDRSG